MGTSPDSTQSYNSKKSKKELPVHVHVVTNHYRYSVSEREN